MPKSLGTKKNKVITQFMFPSKWSPTTSERGNQRVFGDTINLQHYCELQVVAALEIQQLRTEKPRVFTIATNNSPNKRLESNYRNFTSGKRGRSAI